MGEGGRVKRTKMGTRNCDDGGNNSGIKKRERKKKRNTIIKKMRFRSLV
jgi:hypothetical protein